jgi:nucleotide-binding universal stress UspA family protein
VFGVESTQQSYIDVALASSCNKIPVESFVKETVSAGSFASMGKAIVDYVDSRRTTLLVMGSRGMGAWTSSLAGIIYLGSVSDYVTHHARTPLLLVLPPYAATLP